MLTPKEIVATDGISGLKLSRNGSWVVYTVGPKYKAGDHATSALWVAETAKEESARKITSGKYQDNEPAFHPNNLEIFFLSDRHKAGGASQLYRLPFPVDDTDPTPVTPLSNEKGVSSFSISPDGSYVAFVSQDEDAQSNETAVDAEVWGEKKGLGRLRVIDLRNLNSASRDIVSVDAHVSCFTWSPDSSKLIYRLSSLPDVESIFLPVPEEIIAISSQSPASPVTVHSRDPGGTTVWTEQGNLFFVQSVSLDVISSSKGLWIASSSGDSTPVHLAYGDTEDADGIVDLAYHSQVAVEVASGLQTRIDVIDSEAKSFTAFETKTDAIVYMNWDMKRLEDGQYAFVALRSSGVTGKPEDVWYGSTVEGKKGVLSRKLSSHNEWFSGKTAPISQAFHWTSSDNEKIQGIITYPGDRPLQNLPTVVVGHPGPYWRDVFDLYFGHDWWRPFLASQGYLVLSPNYRGSLGRGDKFAKAARGGMGTLDWEDVETMIDEAISQKIADPSKIGIAGYSQGGFLAAWGCTRPNSRFKAGVIYAGVTDWGSMSLAGDMPDLEVDLAGNAPWSSGEPEYLKGSPIRYVKNLKAPLLILHGQEDKRVPVSQAIGFTRGIIHETKDKSKVQLVTYPREGHNFQERAHAEDVLVRLLKHLDLHLK